MTATRRRRRPGTPDLVDYAEVMVLTFMVISMLFLGAIGLAVLLSS